MRPCVAAAVVAALCLAVTAAPQTTVVRHLALQNSCGFEVQVGFTGGSTGPCGAGGTCPAGMVCNPASGSCFWDLPLTADERRIGPGETVVAVLDAPSYVSHGTSQKLSGNLWVGAVCRACSSSPCPHTPALTASQVSTNCGKVQVGPTSATACDTGLCNNGTCSAFAGPTGPYTAAEFTFVDSHLPDFYDVTVINGLNVGISMAPTPGQSLAPASAYGVNTAVGKLYFCGAPGAGKQPPGGLAGASWAVQPTDEQLPFLRLVSVRNGTTVPDCTKQPTCTTDADCTSGTVCGLAMGLNPFGEATPAVCQVCGRHTGWWTANQVCTFTAARPFGVPFNCESSTRFEGAALCACLVFYCFRLAGNAGVGQGNGPDTHQALYGCAGTLYSQSCFSASATDTCCGCGDWTAQGINAPSVDKCTATNADWSKDALPWLKPFKAAAPTAYTYAFDDPSSTFTCASTGPMNAVNYTITFCPQA